MELLLPIVILLFGLAFCLRFLLGARTYEHIKTKLVYDLIKGCISLPFRLGAALLRLGKLK